MSSNLFVNILVEFIGSVREISFIIWLSSQQQQAIYSFNQNTIQKY